jgi:branched-subunit amino acid aminotransferase/4-amino-4-deoxychorismate lyase
MAKFEGVKWMPKQMRYLLPNKQFEIFEAEAKVFALSRSIMYALFICFEGIRFYCKKNPKGQLEVTFLNWHKNLERLRRGIAFNLGKDQQGWVPSSEELENIFIHQYFKDPDIRSFLEKMAALDAQGYLRPFTVDEEHSMGVTFPNQPAIRALACRYDQYLGEPFCGVVIPHLVRAMGVNGTGCLKLGINYLMSVKAIDEARKITPEAAAALFLDDNPGGNLEDRHITEWDSSCCLFALRDGSVIKIPESNLILPSVTIQGMVAVLREMGIPVLERHIAYRELLEKVRSKELIAACSIGTAGILNRCAKLVLVDNNLKIVFTHVPDEGHPLYKKLREARTHYWDIYKEKAKIPAGMNLYKYIL